MVARRTVSFMADASHESRVAEIARVDGVTRSQAAARISAVGALPSSAARRAARFILEEGDEAAKRQLAVAIAKAIARTSNAVLERKLLAGATGEGSMNTEAQIEGEAVAAVAAYRRERRAG